MASQLLGSLICQICNHSTSQNPGLGFLVVYLLAPRLAGLNILSGSSSRIKLHLQKTCAHPMQRSFGSVKDEILDLPRDLTQHWWKFLATNYCWTQALRFSKYLFGCYLFVVFRIPERKAHFLTPFDF